MTKGGVVERERKLSCELNSSSAGTNRGLAGLAPNNRIFPAFLHAKEGCGLGGQAVDAPLRSPPMVTHRPCPLSCRRHITRAPSCVLDYRESECSRGVCAAAGAPLQPASRSAWRRTSHHSPCRLCAPLARGGSGGCAACDRPRQHQRATPQVRQRKPPRLTRFSQRRTIARSITGRTAPYS